jgi:hypothetical protein
MAQKKRSPASKAIWAYAYQIVPPQPEDRLRSIKTLLDHENTDARRGARTWAARVVLERQVTHILVVSDSPEQDREVNRRLEAALQELDAGFSITVPLPVTPEAEPLPATTVSAGS